MNIMTIFLTSFQTSFQFCRKCMEIYKWSNIHLVGGLQHEFHFSLQLEMSSSQLTKLYFQRGRLKPPTSIMPLIIHNFHNPTTQWSNIHGTDELIFFRGAGIPPTSYCWYLIYRWSIFSLYCHGNLWEWCFSYIFIYFRHGLGQDLDQRLRESGRHPTGWEVRCLKIFLEPAKNLGKYSF